MKHMKAKGVAVVAYEPTLNAPELSGSDVLHDLGPSKLATT